MYEYCLFFGVFALTLFGLWLSIRKSREIVYEMYATFANDWAEFMYDAEDLRKEVELTEVDENDLKAVALREEVLARFDEDIRRYAGYVDHYVGLIPKRLHKKFNLP